MYAQLIAAALAAAQGAALAAPDLPRAAEGAPVLEESWVVAEALARHPALQAAEARARSARARPGLYSGIDDPSVALGTEMLPLWVVGEPRKVTLGVSQRIALAPERTHLAAVEEEGAKSAAAAAATVRLDLAVRARFAYHALAEAQGVVRALERSAAVLRDLVPIAHRNYEVGAGTQVDALAAHRESERAESELQISRLEVEAARARLNELVGRAPESALPDPPEPEFHVHPLDAAVLQARALELRPELQGAEREIARADAVVATRADAYWPDLMLQAGAMTDKDAAGVRDLGWMAMVGVRVPIFQERRAAGVEEARQAAAAARADRASLELAVRREVKEAAVAAEQARTQVELYRERLVPLARETLQAALTAYPTGRTDLISVLDAQRALADLDVAGVRALHEYHRRIAALDRAGGVSHE